MEQKICNWSQACKEISSYLFFGKIRSKVGVVRGFGENCQPGESLRAAGNEEPVEEAALGRAGLRLQPVSTS